VDYYAQKVEETQSQQDTLSGEIGKLDNQISLTQSRIYLTESKLGRIGDEMATISGKISLINETLNHASEILLNRIKNNYKAALADPFLYLLTAANFNTFISRASYLQIVQRHDQTLLEQMTLTKKNYSDQKDLLTDVKKKQEDLKKQLKSYQTQLSGQKAEKNKVLAITQNDEKKYQELLSEARVRLAAFSSFAQSTGGGLLGNQTVCNDGWTGCYYNQRDSQWGNRLLPGSNYSFATAGCLATDVAMILSHYGKQITPADMANSPQAFFHGDLLFNFSINGTNVSRTYYSGYNKGIIDSELSAGRPVIIGLNFPSVSGQHFVVLISGSNGNYKMNDPYRESAHNVDFKSVYSENQVIYTNKVVVN
jgi:archaellum component FlaC